MSITLWVMIGLLVLGGVGLTLWDYNRWRHAEGDRYGQGPGERSQLQPAAKLGRPYFNRWAGLRIKYPQNWDVAVSATFAMADEKAVNPLANLKEGERLEVVRFGQPFGEAAIVVSIERFAGGLTGAADREAVGVTRDREYLNSDRLSLTVLTWDQEKSVTQKALAVKEDKLVVIEAVAGLTAWPAYAQTFWAVFASLVLL